MYRKGFWLILIEDDDSEMAVACQVLSRDHSQFRLRALIPPAWYPQTFTAFKVREDGEILGFRRLRPDERICIPAHAGLHSLDVDVPVINAASPRSTEPGSHEITVPLD
jgi:hypothetical protein